MSKKRAVLGQARSCCEASEPSLASSMAAARVRPCCDEIFSMEAHAGWALEERVRFRAPGRPHGNWACVARSAMEI
jgi:hypothetical protein